MYLHMYKYLYLYLICEWKGVCIYVFIDAYVYLTCTMKANLHVQLYWLGPHHTRQRLFFLAATSAKDEVVAPVAVGAEAAKAGEGNDV